MKVAVIGTGYVGLVTGTCFAEVGNDVICVDIDEQKVNRMRQGQIPIYEPGLEEIFQRNIREKRLHFTTSLTEGVQSAEIIFLALPTPAGEDGAADLSYVLGVAKELSKILKNYTVIVNKSTVPVGTADKVAEILKQNGATQVDVVSNPEFLKEGFAVEDFMNPDRIVVGTTSGKARAVMDQLYEPFISEGGAIIHMDERSSELTKYAANTFLAAKITFMNEIANLCELVNADVDSVRLGIGSDQRIGQKFLFSGIGYGGSCFPKDVQALDKIANENGYDFQILKSVLHVNTKQKKKLINKLSSYYGGNLRGRVFALWGLAFKPDTDDIREAPSIEMVRELISAGASVQAFDPEAMGNVKKLFADEPKLNLTSTQYEALKNADALLIATEWNEFRSPDFDRMKRAMKQPVIFDGRNLYRLEDMQQAGFHYQSIGRQIVEANG